MKRKLLSVAVLLALSVLGTAQNKTTLSKKSESGIYTSLKPADGSPYVFGTQQELNDKQASKKGAILSEIKANEKNPERVKALREELWRVENAIVQTKK